MRVLRGLCALRAAPLLPSRTAFAPSLANWRPLHLRPAPHIPSHAADSGVMFSAIKRLYSGGGSPGAAAAGGASCAGCDPEVLSRCEAAEAGSVTPHSHHVFVKLAPPEGADPGAPDESWWPESVDKEPAIAAVSEAIKAAGDRISGKVKVTAFDGLAHISVAPGTADAYVFPAGLHFSGLPLAELPAAVVEALAQPAAAGATAAGGGSGEGEDAAGAAAGKGQAVEGTTIFVCCHAARDDRCGHIGPALAARLAELSAGRPGPGGGAVAVLRTSHIGGHKYAGNVLVYSRGQPLDGDWFGGLNASNAAAFLDALLAAKAPSGAAGERALRPWWRGRVGLSKAEQVQHFEAAVRDIEDL